MSEIKHFWNGTVLTVSSDSGISSADLQGPKGDTGPRGPQGPSGIVYDANGAIIMDGYATENYVNTRFTVIEDRLDGIEEVDLTGYATETYVDEAIAKIDVESDVDLTNYATKDYVSEEIAKAQLDGTEIDTSNFVTQTQMNFYATKTYVTEAVSAQGDDILSTLTNYAPKSYVDSAVAAIEQPSLAGYATETYVDGKITYSTADIEAGVTALATGKLYLVYE